MSESGKGVPRRQRREADREYSRTIRKALTLGAATLASTVPGMPAAQAATFTVTNLNDSGANSLRQAVLDANAAAGADTITFQAGLTGTITLTTGQLAVSDSVDIQGPGAGAISVSGNDASRVFYLYNNLGPIDITISGLTVTGGSADFGAGIANVRENLILDGVLITGNAATGNGGGLWGDSTSSSLTIRDCTITGNTAANGGGIYLYHTFGPVLIETTSIRNNDATVNGGGLHVFFLYDDFNLADSTVSGNTAGEKGGGVYIDVTRGVSAINAGVQQVTRSTISGNTAADGGGVYFYNVATTFTFENSTISGNQATAGNGGGVFLYSFYDQGDLAFNHDTVAGNSATGDGGGLFAASGTVTVEHTIAADNTSAVNNDLGTGGTGNFDLAFSLVESAGTATVTDNGGNILGQGPQLGALADWGGPTQTHRPAGTSPAVNAGNAAFAPPPATDQRTGARIVNGIVDMGSVELAPGTIQLTFNAASVGESAGTITITARRTGGTDGAVSVLLNSADGTAIAPGDYGQVSAILLSWADGDGTDRTFDVSLVNDLEDEPDETFLVILSAPTGGAALGSPATATITIVDDDGGTTTTVEIPTVGDVGRALLTALLGLVGLHFLRRRQAAV